MNSTSKSLGLMAEMDKENIDMTIPDPVNLTILQAIASSVLQVTKISTLGI